MTKPLKPLRVGGEEGEFGETYHVATALGVDERARAVVLAPDRYSAATFLSLFAPEPGRVEQKSKKPPGSVNVVESTRIYCAKWSQHLIQHLSATALQPALSEETRISEFLDLQIGQERTDAALVWIRNSDDPETAFRNSTEESIDQCIEVVQQEGLRPIAIGDNLGKHKGRKANLIRFFKDPVFQAPNSYSRQLLMFEILRRDHGVRLSVGMKSGGMDGPGLLLGLPTISIAHLHISSAWRIRLMCERIPHFLLVPLGRRKFRILTPGEVARLHAEIEEALQLPTPFKNRL